MAINIGTQTGGTINTVSLAAPLDAATQAVVAQLAQRMATAMPWTPFDPVGTFALAMSQNQYPYPTQSVVNPPAWLQDPNRLDIWKQIANAFAPTTQAVLQNQLAVARQQGTILANNVAFWNNVAKYSGTDAVYAVWDDLWAALTQYKAYHDSIVTTFNTVQPILQQYQGQIPTNLVQQQSALIAQFNSMNNRLASVIAPLGAQARAAAGLSSPLIIAGIAAAVVATISASVWAIAHELAAVQLQANTNATAIIQARDAADQAAYSAGKISYDQLQQSRKDSVAAGVDIANSQGAGAVGKGLKSAGEGIALGLGGLAIAGIGGYFLYKHFKKKSA